MDSKKKFVKITYRAQGAAECCVTALCESDWLQIDDGRKPIKYLKKKY